MDIFDFAKCTKCNKSYIGHFTVDLYGNIACEDCKNPTLLSERLVIEDMDKSTYEQYMVLDMLEKDITVLYPLFSKAAEVPLENFIADTGELIPEKVYFQGNDLHIARFLQEKSFLCLKYLDTNKEEHSELVTKIIRKYLDLREKKYSEKEISDLIDLVHSDAFKQVEFELNELY